MIQTFTRCAVVALASVVAGTPACAAQTTASIAAQPSQPMLIAELPATDTPSTTTAELPDAPSSVVSEPNPDTTTPDEAEPERQRRFRLVIDVAKPSAPKYSNVIQPGERAEPLHGAHDLAVFSLNDSFDLYALAGVTISAGWSQLIGTKPHYGPGAEAFGKREGAAALRSTIQNMSADLVFCPVFHDDPRYYVMGNRERFMKRVLYAATRVVITRSNDGVQQRINAPLLLGYGITAAVNNAYYPDQDRGARNTFETWATSLGGAALGFEVDEFAADALRLLHVKK